MITLALARDLFRHMQWADAEIWRVLTPEVTSDKKLMKTVLHLHVVQRAFYLMWTGGEMSFDHLYEKRDPDVLREWARSYYPDADAYIARLDPESLNDIVDMPWLQQFAEQLGDLLQPGHVHNVVPRDRKSVV